MKTYYVTVPGCEEGIREKMKEGDEMIVLRPNRPLALQLTSIPDDHCQVMASPPAIWPEADKHRFAVRVSECYFGLVISRGTVRDFTPLWEENAFWNHERFLNEGISIRQVDHSTQPALICGNGPSLDTSWFKEAFPNGIIYTCWHAAPKIPSTDYVVHLDGLNLGKVYKDFQTPSYKPNIGIIGCPTASRSFFEAYPDSQLFSYYIDAHPIHMRFADKLNLEGDPAVSGSVTDMMVNIAILVNHPEVYLTGVDLSFQSKEEADAYYPNQPVTPYTNNQGVTVWGHPVNETARLGLGALADRNPHIKFFNTSEHGLAIEGFTYINPKEINKQCLTA